MPDLREQVLARLTEVAATVPGIAHAYRNRVGISETARPAILVLDADEVTEEEEFRHSRPSSAPQLVVMTPEVFILLAGSAEDIGTSLNAVRRQFIRRVLTDGTLARILGPNGSIRYAGCATALAAGRSMEGEMGLTFAIRYALKPADLED